MNNMKNKYLVRPNDFQIFELDENENYYKLKIKGLKLSGMPFWTYKLLNNLGFFPIEEDEIPIYENKHNEYIKFISWQSRPDGHGGSKGGTFEEYKRKCLTK